MASAGESGPERNVRKTESPGSSENPSSENQSPSRTNPFNKEMVMDERYYGRWLLGLALMVSGLF